MEFGYLLLHVQLGWISHQNTYIFVFVLSWSSYNVLSSIHAYNLNSIKITLLLRSGVYMMHKMVSITTNLYSTDLTEKLFCKVISQNLN